MTRTRITLVAGLALLAIALGVTLSGSPVVVVHRNSTVATATIAETNSALGACQAGEALPGDISIIRLSLLSAAGPRVSVSALAGTRTLTSGSVGSGWTGGSVAVAVRPVAHPTSPVRICFKLGPTEESVGIVGEPTSHAVAALSSTGKTLPGRFKIEYLRAGSKSWLSLAPEVARRIGLGRAPSGGWIVLPLFALMIVVIAGASWLVVKELP